MNAQGTIGLSAHDREVLRVFLYALPCPYKAIQIPHFQNEASRLQLASFVKDTENLVKVDWHHKVLIVPNGLEYRTMKFLRSLRGASGEGNSALGCVMICDDPDHPKLTEFPVAIYHENGKSESRRMCRDCMLESLKTIVSGFFEGGPLWVERLLNQREKVLMIPLVDCNLNENGEFWPQVSLGGFLMSLCMDGVEMAKLVNIWVTGVYYHCLSTSPDFVTYCPQHHDSLYYLDGMGTRNIHCRKWGCPFSYCRACRTWSDREHECFKELSVERRCPKCLVPTYKTEGCNHMECPCGCHWCYACGQGFASSGEVYNHMVEVHGPYGWEDE